MILTIAAREPVQNKVCVTVPKKVVTPGLDAAEGKVCALTENRILDSQVVRSAG